MSWEREGMALRHGKAALWHLLGALLSLLRAAESSWARLGVPVAFPASCQPKIRALPAQAVPLCTFCLYRLTTTTSGGERLNTVAAGGIPHGK